MSDAGGSSLHQSDEEDFHFGFNEMGQNAQMCTSCFETEFKTLDNSIVCTNCGKEIDNIKKNAKLEYDDQQRGKGPKMKIDDVKEKQTSPKKLSDLRKNVSSLALKEEDDEHNQIITKGFQIIGDDKSTIKKNNNQDEASNGLSLLKLRALKRKSESYQEYLNAYEQMFHSIADKFAKRYIASVDDQVEFMTKVKEIYQQYMDKWNNCTLQDHKPVSSLTMERRGQLRINNVSRYSGLKRTQIESIGNSYNLESECKEEALKKEEQMAEDKIEQNQSYQHNPQSQELQNLNRSHYSSIKEENEIEIEEGEIVDSTGGINPKIEGSEQINTELNPSVNFEKLKMKSELQQFDLFQKIYYKTRKTHRKRDAKKSSKMSTGSTSADGSTSLLKTNYMLEIQDLRTKEDAEILLDFTSIECFLLTLLQRAKLFVKLKYSDSDLISSIKEIKFKRTSNVLINDSILPSKLALIKICKEKLQIDYRCFKLLGLKTQKDRIIITLFLYHLLLDKSSVRDYLTSKKLESTLMQLGKDSDLEEGQIPDMINPEDIQDIDLNMSRKQVQEFIFHKYEQELEQNGLAKKSLEEQMMHLFLKRIKEENENVQDEFNAMLQKPEESTLAKTKPPTHSLELNLILAFIYMASRQYGILEGEVLKAAQNNTIGYLTAFKKHRHLAKANYLLRPINVPFRNKWLRDISSDFHKIDKINMTSSNIYQLVIKISDELFISPQVKNVTLTLLNLVQHKLKQQLFPQFEAVGLLIIAFKLLYGLNDESQELAEQHQQLQLLLEIEDLKHLHNVIHQQIQLPSFQEQYENMMLRLRNLDNTTLLTTSMWRTKDLCSFKILDKEIKFSEQFIYTLRDSKESKTTNSKPNEIDEGDQRFKSKVNSLSDKFSNFYNEYRSNQRSSQVDNLIHGDTGYRQSFKSEEEIVKESMDKISLKEEEKQENSEDQDFENTLDQLIPSRAYSLYQPKMQKYACEAYHFQFMMIVQVFQDYLNEPTCQDILKHYKQVEMHLLRNVKF
ncbi:UNKNOWN [Stylonychia lemnae]|uniref:Uncharacterized protein n=1 Tax=Stylonychia lemnae TaxID=5949 RepID=A0A078B5W9_STYLE|nr:UNKNOWN [Stylonychia lemnae]|eukprot:CDW89905.1 UNKNOWN [Stylonychia lemnae]